MLAAADSGAHYQQHFHQRWGALRDPHVRALAWLIDSPDLLDKHAAPWAGRIASLPADAAERASAWLHQLDAAPDALDQRLALHPFARLGRYAESLLAFYFEHLGILAARNLQVRAEANRTIGEFDFLIWRGSELLHWEFATKFYLLQAPSRPDVRQSEADYFVGPNLADSLGAKIHKIFDRQLALSRHPAAQPLLPQPVHEAQALVKGWLFYHAGQRPALAAKGVSAAHCHGFWCGVGQLADAEAYCMLPRLSWLAPARASVEDTLNRAELEAALAAEFARERMPVLVALMRSDGDVALEWDRGFIVPEDWSERAHARLAAVP
jgi:hypothetical protein